MGHYHQTDVPRYGSDLTPSCIGAEHAYIGFQPYDMLETTTASSRSWQGLWPQNAQCASVRPDISLSRSNFRTQLSKTSYISSSPDSFHRLLELPQELLQQIYRAYCKPCQITFSYPPQRPKRTTHRQLRPLKRLRVQGPPSANFSMANSKIYSELEELRRDAFNGEVQIQYDDVERLDALRELCTNDRYSWVRERLVKLVIRGVKGLDFGGPDYLLDCWNSVAKLNDLSQLREIDVIYEAERAKYVVKEANFELPTEEWFRVSAQEYIESFRQGDEDIEYEYPGGLLQLRELKQLLSQNGKPNCEVFLTTRVTWRRLRDNNVASAQNGHESVQSVTFRVVSDDLEGTERLYQ